jgi:hypothetical protein
MAESRPTFGNGWEVWLPVDPTVRTAQRYADPDGVDYANGAGEQVDQHAGHEPDDVVDLFAGDPPPSRWLPRVNTGLPWSRSADPVVGKH